MSTRRIIWILLSILNLIFFFFIIPVDVYNKSTLLLSLVGATIFFGILFQVFANYDSLYDLFEKGDLDEPVIPGRKMAPFSIVPATILLFVLMFYHTERKNEELKAHGVLTKGTIISGESGSGIKTLHASASYSIMVEYVDSMDCRHTVEETIEDYEFDSFYKGAAVDVVYSSIYPGLASVVLEKEELVKFKEVSNENLSISHLIKLLEGNIKDDSIMLYLNSINNEWVTTSEKGYFQNDNLNMVIKLSSNNHHMVYVKKSKMLVAQNAAFSFEEDIVSNGFKKNVSVANGESKEQYHNDKYVIKKEWQQLGNTATGDGGYDIYYIARIDSVKE